MNKPYLIGIAGGSGSGKTTFLKSLLSHFSEKDIALVSQDNYYKPKHLQELDANGWVNFDLPSSIDRDHFFQDITALKLGHSIEKIEYNFNNPQWTPSQITIHSAPVIIIEGLFIFCYEEIRAMLDYKVFLDAHHDERLNRRIQRDSIERGYPKEEVEYQWHNHVRPSEEKWLMPYYKETDLIIDNSISFDEGMNVLIAIIQRALK